MASEPATASEAEDPIQRALEQGDRRRELEEAGDGAWTILYESWRTDDANGARHCALSPPTRREKVLSGYSWDLSIGDGAPGFVEYGGGEDPEREYLRYGTTDDVEPLVLTQDHYGMRPRMLPQLSEEFRLYHNLWVSDDGRELIKVNMDGSEEVVAEISHDLVRVRTKYLRQFQAGRQLDLVILMDSVRFVADPDETATLGEIGPPNERDDVCITLHASDHVHGRKRPFSRLLGKKVLPPPEQAKAGIWPFDEHDEIFHEFIIDEDKDGDAVKHTCDPDQLANYFGKNPDAPHYLTPVFFRRDVLQRYYERPEKYSVEDGYLRCGSLWGLRLDNDHPHHVMVFLGDLGRDLPESERPYWQSFNVVPTGGMSATVWKRSFEGEPADPEAPDLRFKSRYGRFKTKWEEATGWTFFKDPEPDDEHVLQRLRIPLNDSQPEFEDQVIGLAKLLVDALDEKSIRSQLDGKVADEKGISKLERWMEQEQYPFRERDISFLRRLQRLRSKLVAHRKGSDYSKVLEEEDVDEDTIREVVVMLWNAERLLRDLARHVGVDLDSY